MSEHVAVLAPRAAVLRWVPLALALLGLFVIGFDQGQLLSLAQGDLAYQANLLHEFFHDARHAAGFPCH